MRAVPSLPVRSFPILSALVLSLLCCTVHTAQAQPVPRLVSFQGVLYSSGSPVTSATNVDFALFSDAACATAFPSGSAWTQTLLVTPDAAGVFSVLLGSTDPANAAYFGFAFDRLLYLKTSIGGGQVACQLLAAAPYALGLYGLRVEPAADPSQEGPNVIGGWEGNSVAAGVVGATIAGGGDPDTGASTPHPNQVTADYGTVGGGRNNTASALSATVGGGDENTASALSATVGGGSDNTASGVGATVGGGGQNLAFGNYDTVAGGVGNEASGVSATVGGGQLNEAGGPQATVGGGDSNTAGGTAATVGGGKDNTTDGGWATVGGGANNLVSGDYSMVGGGVSNTASANYATVGGGASNSASGFRATVPGGESNQAGGSYSFAAGRRAKVRDATQSGDSDGDEGTFVWADSDGGSALGTDFASTGPDQFLIRAAGGVGIGTNNPQETLHILDPASASALFLGGGATVGPHGFVFEDETAGAGLQLFYRTGANRLLIEKTSLGTGTDGTDAFFYDRDDDLFYFNGNVGIGTTAPSVELDVNGNIEAITVTETSDGRYKRDLAAITGALSKVEAMRGVRYRWKREAYPEQRFEAGQQLGFIAQELAEVLPEVVKQGEDGMLSVAYSQVIPVLVEAVKAQQQLIERQQAENERQQAQIAALEAERGEVAVLRAEMARQQAETARQQAEMARQQAEMAALRALVERGAAAVGASE